MTARERYDELVAESPQGSIFSSSWWLDAVAPEAWEPHLLEDGDLRAAWPTVLKRNRWARSISGFSDPISRTYLAAARGWQATLDERGAKHRGLLESLGPYAHLEARCHPSFAYWAPLAWHGCTQTTRYTWRLTELADMAAVESGCGPTSEATFARLASRASAWSRGTSTTCSSYTVPPRAAAMRRPRRRGRTIEAIDGPASTRDARRVLVARGDDGQAHAAGYFVWDDDAMYYLVGVSDKELRSSGATSLLLWTAIELAAERGLIFDFEGSMIRSIERFFRAFGGAPAAYSVVRHTPRAGLRAERAMKRAIRAMGRR